MVMHKVIAVFAIGALSAFSLPAQASHAWSDYHWARTTASFDLLVVNSTTAEWDAYVVQAVGDWSQSGRLNMVEEPNGSTSSKDRRQCKGPTGKVRICNLAYGYTGWLGVAGISINADGHIITGYTKLNDSYFSSASYDTPAWRQMVTCQELGHNVGLGHQDENFYNQPLFTCMDYQDEPYEYPNSHDFEQLEAIYGHLDSYNSYAAPDPATPTGGDDGTSACNSPPGKGCNKMEPPGNNQDVGWGMSLGRRGHSETFIRIDPDGTRHITHVLWVDDGDAHAH